MQFHTPSHSILPLDSLLVKHFPVRERENRRGTGCSPWSCLCMQSLVPPKVVFPLCFACALTVLLSYSHLPALEIQGRKKQHKHKLFGPDFPQTFLTLTPRMPWGQKVSPHHRGRRKTHFLVRTSMIFGADVHDPKGC